MKCPVCNAETIVKDSRASSGLQARIRQCSNPACGKKFATSEQPDTNSPDAYHVLAADRPKKIIWRRLP